MLAAGTLVTRLLPGSVDLVIPCRFFRCFVLSPVQIKMVKNLELRIDFSYLSLTFVSKFISTHVALEGPLPCVPPVVVLQLAARLKVLLADIAHKPGAETSLK